MKWKVTLHGGENHGKKIVFEADSADMARRIAIKEMEDHNARVFELERAD